MTIDTTALKEALGKSFSYEELARMGLLWTAGVIAATPALLADYEKRGCALAAIAEFPVADDNNMPAHNMAIIGRHALGDEA